MPRPGNTAATRLYHRHGFAETGLLPGGDIELELPFQAPAHLIHSGT